MEMFHGFTLQFAVEMMQGKSEINDAESFVIAAEEFGKVRFVQRAGASEFGNFVSRQGEGRRGKVDAGVSAHFGATQRGHGEIGIPAGQIEEGERPVAFEHFAAQDGTDLAMEERVVLDAEAVDLPLREEGVDGFRHGGQRGRRVAGRRGRATTR